MTNFSSGLTKLFKQARHCPFQKRITENVNEIWRSFDPLGNSEGDAAALTPGARYRGASHIPGGKGEDF